MFLKKCDYLSPSITLYFKGFSIHSSMFSGFLTIITYIIIFAFGIYYSLLYIYKNSPNIYYYTKYIEDIGIIPLNESSLFHFIKFGNTNTRENQNIDFDSIRIFGFESEVDIYLSNNNLSQYNHWIYGLCNSNDIKNIKNLANNLEFPEKSACIRYYFDTKTQKYYNTSDNYFKWPALLHGASNDNCINYGIILEKCRNDSLKNNCRPEEDIDNYIENLYAILFFIDYYADVLSYENPYKKYLNKLTDGLFSNSFTVNNLNFNPMVITNNFGTFTNNKHYGTSYMLSQNEKTTSKNSNNSNIITCFYFWMQNIILTYDRHYEGLEDLLSNIGGIESFLKFIATLINSFYVNYRILLDTEELVLNTDKINFKKVSFRSKPTFLKKASQIFNPPKKKLELKNNLLRNTINDIKNKNHSSIIEILLKEKSDIFKLSNKNNLESKSQPFQNINKKNSEINLSQNKSKKILNNSLLSKSLVDNDNKKENSRKNNNNNNNKKDSNSLSLSMSNKESIKALETKNNEETYKPLTKQNFSWFSYLFHAINGGKNPKISYYEDFRKEVISEETIIQNHINIFKLLKFCKIQNYDPFCIKKVDKNIC